MSSIINSVSFRSVRARRVELRSVDEHDFFLGPNELQHLHGSIPLLAEMGGAQGLALALRSDVKAGIYADEATAATEDVVGRRELIYGTNVYPKPLLKTYWQFCWEAATDIMLIVLIVAGVISIVLGLIEDPSSGWYEGLSIILAVFLVVVIGATNNYQQQQQFAKLDRTEEVDLCSIIRGGEAMQIHPDRVQVGDLVCLSAGGFIPADGIIVADESIKVNESKMTGESIDIKKDFYSPFLSGGTEVREGQCIMLVTAIGIRSAYGRILAALATEDEQTPLQMKLERIATFIGYVGAAVAIALFIILFSEWLNNEVVGKSVGKQELSDLLRYVITCVTIIVVAVPEGLPLAVTISLAYSMQRMYNDQIVVHKLSACETMGNATTICSDKTGTLTQNLMTVVRVYLGGATHEKPPSELTVPLRKLLIESLCVNSRAYITEEDEREQRSKDIAPELWLWREGNQTEISLMAFLTRLDIPITAERNKYVVTKSYPFDSIKKQSSVVIALEVINSPDELHDASVVPMAAVESAEMRQSLVYKHSPKHEFVKPVHESASPLLLTSVGENESDAPIVMTKSDRRRDHTPNTPHSNNSGRRIDSARRSSAIRQSSARRPGSSYRLNPRPEAVETEIAISAANERVKEDESKQMSRLGYRQYLKGAAEVIVASCKRRVNQSGHVVAMSASEKQSVGRTVDNWTRKGLRCIAFAFVDFNSLPRDEDDNILDPPSRNDCVLVGFVGIQDPLRPEAYVAVRACQRAGIIVRMVTGDHIETAKSIAAECGIFTSNYHIAMTGDEFRKLVQSKQESQLEEVIPRLRVLARSKPEDKETLVNWLKAHGQIVAATGDGTNDAPALKAANVGIAMFIQGTAVAKSAAQIWILDDNFQSIVKAVMWGRSVYDNIRKFIQFQLTVNVVALVLALVGSLTDAESPLTAVQLLWVNLIMDTFAALALGTERPNDLLLLRKPYQLDAFIISPVMWRNIFAQAIYQLAVLFILLYYTGIIPGSNIDHDTQYTMIFNTFVFLQLFNEFNCRKVNGELNILSGLFENPIYWGILILTCGFQILMVEVFGAFASTVKLDAAQWGVCIALAAGSLPVGVIQRMIHVDVAAGSAVVDDRAFEGAHLDDPEYDLKRVEQDDHQMDMKPSSEDAIEMATMSDGKFAGKSDSADDYKADVIIEEEQKAAVSIKQRPKSGSRGSNSSSSGSGSGSGSGGGNGTNGSGSRGGPGSGRRTNAIIEFKDIQLNE